MSGTGLSSPLRGEKHDQEPCYKCSGEGGEVSIEGPHTLWHPCFKCGNSGWLPKGTLEADLAAACPDCRGAGGEMSHHPEDAQCDGWRNCRACRGTGRRDPDHA